MRLLTFTNLYPSEDMPRHGIFVEERLRKLVASGRADASVVALRPRSAHFFRSGGPDERHARSRHGIAVDYVPVPTLRAVTNWIDPLLWARAAEGAVVRRLESGSLPVVLDAHFLYPDGVAAVIIGERLGLPVVITARGSDVNVKCNNPVMRRWIQWAARRCSALITVSEALAVSLRSHGVSAPVLEVLPNGVDLEKFRPLDKAVCRSRLALGSEPLLLSVGHLVPEKGHAIAIEALTKLPTATLLIVGQGRELGSLESLARRLGVASRVRFAGLIGHDDMATFYSAADALLLPSLREGMPNVMLESLACGTPVIATNAGGTGEVLTSPQAGELMRERSAAALLDALERLLARNVASAETRRFAERLGWDHVIDRQLALYERAVAAAGEPRLIQAEAR